MNRDFLSQSSLLYESGRIFFSELLILKTKNHWATQTCQTFILLINIKKAWTSCFKSFEKKLSEFTDINTWKCSGLLNHPTHFNEKCYLIDTRKGFIIYQYLSEITIVVKLNQALPSYSCLYYFDIVNQMNNFAWARCLVWGYNRPYGDIRTIYRGKQDRI